MKKFKFLLSLALAAVMSVCVLCAGCDNNQNGAANSGLSGYSGSAQSGVSGTNGGGLSSGNTELSGSHGSQSGAISGISSGAQSGAISGADSGSQSGSASGTTSGTGSGSSFNLVIGTAAEFTRSAENPFNSTQELFLNLYDNDKTSNLAMAYASAVIVHSTTTKELTGADADVAGVASGVIYKLDKTTGVAYIITNYHVVYNITYGVIADKINIALPNNNYTERFIEATFIGGAQSLDIAVIRAQSDRLSASCEEAVVRDSNTLAPCEEVYSIANSAGGGISATNGVISVLSESLDVEHLKGIHVFRHSAEVNRGVSGGGMYDSQGRLVGISNALNSVNEGFGYAIPTSLAIGVVNNVLYNSVGTENKQMVRSLLGIVMSSTPRDGRYDSGTQSYLFDYELTISEVVENGIAHGILCAGDIIESITLFGKTFDKLNSTSVMEMLFCCSTGDTVIFNIDRSGEKLAKTVEFAISARSYFN